jgi:hypothetical protein
VLLVEVLHIKFKIYKIIFKINKKFVLFLAPVPATTPGSAQSVFISISLIAFCAIVTLVKAL